MLLFLQLYQEYCLIHIRLIVKYVRIMVINFILYLENGDPKISAALKCDRGILQEPFGLETRPVLDRFQDSSKTGSGICFKKFFLMISMSVVYMAMCFFWRIFLPPFSSFFAAFLPPFCRLLPPFLPAF